MACARYSTAILTLPLYSALLVRLRWVDGSSLLRIQNCAGAVAEWMPALPFEKAGGGETTNTLLLSLCLRWCTYLCVSHVAKG